MAMQTDYARQEPSRADIDALRGPALLEFGSPWCGHCRRVQPMLQATFDRHPQVAHLKVADGSGQPLGRSFGVKLWPTLIFLRDGREVERLVRPTDATEIERALRAIDPDG
ncbi:MAG TPA: thioredoxin family protein [Burkholderiaceae bacterium]|jgi:thioredoxin 1|nr:thioredoxin family protein [Burkholderiaceae bacterium]